MVCKECLEFLGEYLDGTLGEKQQAELDEHFEDCPPCVAFLNTYKATTRVCKSALEEIVVPEEVCRHIKSYLMEKAKKSLSS